MKKFFVLFLFVGAEAFCADYTGRLPSHITLNNGENISHNLTSICGNQYCYAGLPSAFNPSAYDFSYSTNGGNSSLTIHAITPPNNINQTMSVFYVGNLSVGANSKLSLNDFHTLSIQKGISLGENATLEVILQKGKKINSSEFGPSSKIIFSHNSSFNLGKGSTFNASNMDFFIISSQGVVGSGAKMIVDSSTIRIQNRLQNFGNMELTGNVWNVGQSANGIDLATSNMTNTEGNIKINGNFYNGGKPTADTIQGGIWQNDAPSPGGGNLISYGGTIHVTGQLINQQGVEISQKQNSSVQIYGGTLRVDGGMTNEKESTFIIGSYNGQMGKLEGKLTNNGSVVIDTAGINMGNHQIITGGVSGQGKVDVIYRSGSNEFINATFNNGTLQIQADQNKIAQFQSTLNGNERQVLKAFDSILNGIYTYGGSTTLRNVASNTQNGIGSTFINAPLAMLDSMQSNIMLDNIMSSGFNAGVFSSGVIGESIGAGALTGIKASYNGNFASQEVSASLGYGYGFSKQDFSVYNGLLDSHILALALVDKFYFDNIEINLGAHAAFGFFNSNAESKLGSTSLKSSGSFNSQKFLFNSSVGYIILIDNVMLMPYAGLQQHYISSGEYSDKDSMNINVASYGNYLLGMVLGLEAKYTINARSNLFANMGYEPILYKSRENAAISINGNPLSIDTLYSSHRILSSIGAVINIKDNMYSNFELFYRLGLGNSSSHIFGIKANFVYRF